MDGSSASIVRAYQRTGNQAATVLRRFCDRKSTGRWLRREPHMKKAALLLGCGLLLSAATIAQQGPVAPLAANKPENDCPKMPALQKQVEQDAQWLGGGAQPGGATAAERAPAAAA